MILKTPESLIYDTNYLTRTSAYGFLSAVSRIAGILGTLTFGHFMYVSRAVPMLTTCTVLLLGGLAALKLPETRDLLV